MLAGEKAPTKSEENLVSGRNKLEAFYKCNLTRGIFFLRISYSSLMLVKMIKEPT